MNKLVTAIAIAAATWAVQHYLNRPRLAAKPRPQLDSWENEGGALAPHHAAMETSQVPR